MRIFLHRAGTIALALSIAALAAGITGCSVSTATSAATSAQALSGRVHGGVQPIANATIQIYAPGTTGYGSAAAPLLTSTVTTDSNGSFSLNGGFTCPSAATPVYMVVIGGNPGLAPGTNNSAISLMGLLGPCGNLSASTFVDIGELTTVAAVWSLAPFMVDYAHIGTSPGNVQGLLNAFTIGQSLANISTGTTPGSAPAIATIPVAEINTIGSILSTCVNTDGSTISTSGCGRLFAAATAPVGVAPSDTIAAALNMARNPGRNVGAIFSSLVAGGPYQPTLTVAPGDWTIAINYVSPTFQALSDLAIDSQGNAWVVSAPSGGTPATTISILNTSGLSGIYPQAGVSLTRIALDPYDDPWLSSNVGSSVVELSGSGTRVGNPFTGGGIQGPGPLAFDGSGNVWITNNGPTVSKLSANGAALSPSTGFSTGGTSAPAAIALDTAGNSWIADSVGNDIVVLGSSGSAIAGSPYTGGGLSFPFALAIDSSGGAWVGNLVGSSLSRFTSDGTPIAGSPFYGAGLNQPIDLVLDGLDNVWLVNSGSNSVSEFLSTGRPQSGSTGYGSAVLSNPFRAAIDTSGNVWVANLGSSTPGTGVITEIVGAAAPVVTPKSVAIQNNALDQRP